MTTTKQKQLTPVQVCVLEFGGVRKMGRIIGRNCGSISKWSKSGLIPTSIQPTVLKKAWELNLNISPLELIMGREE